MRLAKRYPSQRRFFGNRIEKNVDSTITRFAYDGWNSAKPGAIGNENFDIWGDFTSGGSLTTRYLRGDKVDEILARINGTTPRWYLTDHQGSIRQVIDNDGVVKDAITYDAFGNILSETNTAERGRYAWTGREIDVEIQMQFNRARYYDPVTARWVTQDPLGFDAGDSNLYRYVTNQSTQATDPSGLDRIEVGRDGAVYWQIETPGKRFGSWWRDDVGSPIRIGTTTTSEMLKYSKNNQQTPEEMVSIDYQSANYSIPMKALKNIAKTGWADGVERKHAFNFNDSFYSVYSKNSSKSELRLPITRYDYSGQLDFILNEALAKDRQNNRTVITATTGTPEWWSYQDRKLKEMGYGYAYRQIFRTFMPVEGSYLNILTKVAPGFSARGAGNQVASIRNEAIRAAIQPTNQPVATGRLNPGPIIGVKSVTSRTQPYYNPQTATPSPGALSGGSTGMNIPYGGPTPQVPSATARVAPTDFAPGRLEWHYIRHAGEWVSIGMQPYRQRARSLLSSDVGGDIMGFTSREGWVFRYNSRTNELAIMKPDGTIETLFRPTRGVDYYNDQIARFGAR